MKYPWILFDADDTLFDFHRSADFAFNRTLEEFGIKHETGHFDIYKQINEQAWHAFEKNEISAVELRKIRFEKFLAVIGEYRDPLEMNSLYLAEISTTPYLINGAEELVLGLLAKKHKLGLITNGLKEVQRPRIFSAKMEEYFEVIVVSDEIGVSKPDSRFFEYAYQQMGFPEKKQVLVVGDSLNSDIQGGINFGLDTCWFNPGRKANLTPHQPTFEIASLAELKIIVSG